MTTVFQLVDKIGRRKFEDAGLAPQVISRAISEGLMPPGWFPVVRGLCHEKGIPVPEELFRWTDKRKSPRKQGSAA